MKLAELLSPADIRKAGIPSLEELSGDIRRTIIETVPKTGGHLSSNLGLVDVTVALYHVFDFSRDKLLFDVGHQCYAHKLLTGRAERFGTLRHEGGLCGFPRTEESPYDLFNTGHSSSALSLALGLARAQALQGKTDHIAVIVGDGALTGGMCYEALNDIGHAKLPLIIVLNDNEMSISRNVGAMSEYLTFMRLSKGWQRIKHTFSKALLRVPLCGRKLHDLFQRGKDHIRNIFVNDKFFSSLGIRYIGPVDGHSIGQLSSVFERASHLNEPVLIHVMTQKGKGFPPAEADPEHYHNVPPAQAGTDAESAALPRLSFGEEACRTLCEAAERDGNVVLISAAMLRGTGFQGFQTRFPARTFDVGIAEEHAAALAAGMAKGGLRPVVAIYDTFLQRAYDQIMEDVCAQKLPVVFMIDHAQIVGPDGMSHHGIYGASYLRTIPGLTILQPRCPAEMRQMLLHALSSDSAYAIRYPKCAVEFPPYRASFQPGIWEEMRPGRDAAILAAAEMTGTALRVSDRLEKSGLRVRVVNASSLRPLDEETLRRLQASGTPFFTLEENERSGGFGSAVAEWCVSSHAAPPRGIFALPDAFLPHGDRGAILKRCGLDEETLSDAIAKELKK